MVYLGTRLSNHPLTQSATQCTASVHTSHILDGSSNECDPAAIVCCFTPIGGSTHVFQKKTAFFSSLAFFRATFSLVFAMDSAMVENMLGVVSP